jgi:hypothetical protein
MPPSIFALVIFQIESCTYFCFPGGCNYWLGLCPAKLASFKDGKMRKGAKESDGF